METNVKCKPDFLIIGAMKSGTTTLYSDLKKLKHIYLSSDKEPSILAKYSAPNVIKSKYSLHFKRAKTNQLCGEASTTYTSLPAYPCIVDRAADLCGDKLKLLMIMRDPVARVYSHIRHDLATGRISPKDADELVLSDPKYIALSNYAMQLKPWIKAFGVKNLHCISFNEYKAHRVKTINEIIGFLNIDSTALPESLVEIHNKSDGLKKTPYWCARIRENSFYRHAVRPLMSDQTISRIRQLILPDAEVPTFTLSAQVQAELRTRLSDVENDLAKLIGKRIILNDTNTDIIHTECVTAY